MYLLYMNYSLSDKDIRRICGNNTKVITYPDLNYIFSIDQLVTNDKPNCVILIETDINGNKIYGHWIAFKKIGRKLCYFDSYGYFIDEPLTTMDYEFKKKSNQLKYKLSELLKQSNYDDINYNEYQYQSINPSITTCGRWSSYFCLSGLNTDEFHSLMYNLKKIMNKSYDEIICILTNDLF